jgi:hypothetical protein
VIAVDPQGKAIAANGLRFELLRETWEYRWYSVNGVWRHKSHIRSQPIDTGSLDAGPEAPATLSRHLPAGRYRWEVTDPTTGAQSSLRFHVGWWVEAELPDVPDKLEAVFDKTSYQPGETAKLFIKAPFAGSAELAIASDRVLSLRALDLPAGGASLDVPVDASWGSGVYAWSASTAPGMLSDRNGADRGGRLGSLAGDRQQRSRPCCGTRPARCRPPAKFGRNSGAGLSAAPFRWTTAAGGEHDARRWRGGRVPAQDGRGIAERQPATGLGRIRAVADAATLCLSLPRADDEPGIAAPLCHGGGALLAHRSGRSDGGNAPIARSARSSNCSVPTAASGCGATPATPCRGLTPMPPIFCCAPRSTAKTSRFRDQSGGRLAARLRPPGAQRNRRAAWDSLRALLGAVRRQS